MPPIDLLCGLLFLTAAAVVINRKAHHRQQAIFRQLAVEHQMHYSPRDPLRLTPRVAAVLPLPGAAAVRVIDLLYRTDDQFHYYVFTAEYTTGVAGPKNRIRRAAAFTESKTAGGSPGSIRLAAVDLPLVEQYKSLVEKGA